MPEPTPSAVRRATTVDVAVVGRLLHDFNLEFEEPTPGATVLAARMRRLLDGGDTIVLLSGDGADGLAVLRLRASIWNEGLECYLAELYVVPGRRGRGIGRALLEAALEAATEAGAGTIDLGADASDEVARHLYARLGFSNRSGGPDGPVMYVYERELPGPGDAAGGATGAG